LALIRTLTLVLERIEKDLGVVSEVVANRSTGTLSN
jgi:hypothetical protein